MSSNGFANYPECTLGRAHGYGSSGNKSSLSHRSRKSCESESAKEREMNKANQLRLGVAVLLLAAATAIFAGLAGAQALAEGQCSLVAVSRLLAKQENVCETKVVQELAQKGHAFEQNQLGIA